MAMKLDEINRAIIRELKDGRRTFSSVAESLLITENTVRNRVYKMLEDGLLEVTSLIDPEKVPGLQVVIMGVKLKTLDLETKAKEFIRLKGVVDAAVVTGRYDLIVRTLLCEDEGLSLLDFFKTELVRVKDILEVETFVVYQSHGMMVPLII